MPTLADITNKPLEKNIEREGISLWPVLMNDKANVNEHEYLYWEFHENKTSDQAIRMGNWKAVRHDPNGLIELYDLKNDEKEQNNIADKHPDILNKMQDLLKHARTDHPLWQLKTGINTKYQTGKDIID